jgi:hypothetical protein
MIKKDAQTIHALKRLEERYGKIAKPKFLGELVGKIKSGESNFIFAQSLRVSCHKVARDDIDYFVIYDNKRKSIVTFLTREMANSRLEKEKELNKKDLTIFVKEVN